ncbi:guanylate cyclase 2G-like [Paramacrobiotus metropolitanus]|uniref:guanylate cyclase 2G-like n=1 Tax=Paramacrobiotus metropolitanus TaxID=2943436 RepID=UPI002445E3F9|nr:guanylate cyclase 2G-like [Paramacrobiotus metropolitanus]
MEKRKYCYCSRIFLIFMILASCVNSRRVILLSVQSWTSLPSSLNYVGAPIDLAVMTVNERYMDDNMVFSVVDWQRNQSRTCGDVQNDVLPFVTEYYTAQRWKQSADDVFVLLATACSEAVGYLADLAREWNILVMTAGGTDAALENKRRFPTLLRLAPFQQQDLTDVVMSLLQQYNWTNLALICDDSATEFNTFFLICRALPDVIKKRHSVVLTHLHYDFKANPDYERYLTEAATYSRVLLISTHGSRLRNILVVASKMGMANGERLLVSFPSHPRLLES